MWEKKKVSVVFPAYNEENNIKRAVNNFLDTGIVDEVIVVDNNSRDRTAEEVKKTKAKLVTEKEQGYGAALRRGLNESSGYYVFTAEPDGTFEGKDVFKFLMYSEEFDVVFGTRTSKSLIWDNAKMDWFLRIGNVFIAKILEYTHNGPSLTDVGCTMKLVKRPVLNKIKDKLTVKGSYFSPEFMMACIKSGFKCVEIPINYKERIGASKITNTTWKSFKLGIRMIVFILFYNLTHGKYWSKKS